MEKIRFECLNCSTKLAVPATSAGKTLKCPKCGVDVAVDPPEDEVGFKDPTPPPQERPLGIVRGHRAAEPTKVAKPFTRSLDAVFLYPFTTFGSILFFVFVLPAWTLLRSVNLPFGFIAQWIVGGYIATYMWNVMYDTSMGKDRAPGGPPLTDLYELVGHFFRFFGASVVAFAPAVGLMIYATSTGMFRGEVPAWFWAALGVSGLFGVAYYPMALLLIGFSESWITGFNYVFGVRSILKLRGDYLVCTIFFVATFGAGLLLELLWVSAAGNSLAAGIVAAAVSTAAVLYLYAVQMRALGLLYVCNKDRLGWFR